MDSNEVDRAVSALAEAQHGLVTIAQTQEAGATDAMRQHRRANGRWAPATGQVLRVNGAPRTWQQRIMAATLDAGPRAVATRRTAAALWHLPGFSMREPEVLAPRGTDHRPTSGTLIESRWLPDHHVTRRQGVPVVTPARLMVELAASERPQRVERVVDSAIAASILTPDCFATAVAELCHRGRKGSTVLKELALEILPGYVPPASELEARFRDLVRTAGIRVEMVLQANVGGDEWIGRVDVLFPSARLVVELDSRRWHTSRMARESDLRRTNRLELAGWRVLQITWRRLMDDPVGVVHELRQLLAQAAAAA